MKVQYTTWSILEASMKIGVIDSGSGGLFVLRALTERFPNAEFVYLADGAYFPYSEKSAEQLIKRGELLAQQLSDAGCQLVVVACNTLTVTALASLRESFPQLPFVGTVPAVKQAAETLAEQSTVLVLATAATAASQYLRELLEPYLDTHQWHVIGTTELVTAIEKDGTELQLELLGQLLNRLPEPPTGVVLGCTHFSAVGEPLQQLLGSSLKIFEPHQGICNQVARLVSEMDVTTTNNSTTPQPITWLSTASDADLYRERFLLLAANKVDSN